MLNAIRVIHVLDDEIGYDPWGVITDLPEWPRSRGEGYPVERIGIATSVPLPVRSFAAVQPGSPAYKRVRDRLVAAFDSAAARARSMIPASHRLVAPVPEPDIALRSISLDERTVLFEIRATRRFSNWVPAATITYSGWAIDDGKRIVLSDPERIGPTDADRGAPNSYAFGAIVVDRDLYVVGAVSGYEEEKPTIWKWTGTAMTPVLQLPW